MAYVNPNDDPAVLNRLCVISQIKELEAKQARPLRELALGDETALERIQAIDAAIVALRATLDA